jgi:hypothetical protein
MTHETLLYQYKKICDENPDEFMRQVGSFQSVRGILTETYRELVKEGKCQKIEDLEPEEKRELWETAKTYSIIQEKNYLIEVSKALHGFGSWIKSKM